MGATQLISSIMTMTQQMKKESENPGKYHYYDGVINDDAKKMDWRTMKIFYGFQNNEDVTINSGWRKMDILVGFMRMRMLPARMMRTIWMH